MTSIRSSVTVSRRTRPAKEQITNIDTKEIVERDASSHRSGLLTKRRKFTRSKVTLPTIKFGD